jgi:hypothetical protein
MGVPHVQEEEIGSKVEKCKVQNEKGKLEERNLFHFEFCILKFAWG